MATIGAWQEGYSECEVLLDDCKIYDGMRSFKANKCDIIYLPDYNASLEEQGGFVSIVLEEEEAVLEPSVVTQGALNKQVTYDEGVHETTQLQLSELKKITKHLESMTHERVTDEDI